MSQTNCTKQLKAVVPPAMNQAVTDLARELGVSRGTIIRNALEAYVHSPNPYRTPFVESKQGDWVRRCVAKPEPEGTT